MKRLRVDKSIKGAACRKARHLAPHYKMKCYYCPLLSWFLMGWKTSITPVHSVDDVCLVNSNSPYVRALDYDYAIKIRYS